MKKRLSLMTASAVVALFALGGSPSVASSHREAPAITELRKVDGTDFYMFRSYEPGREGFVTFIANYQPLQGPGDGPTTTPWIPTRFTRSTWTATATPPRT